MKNNLDAIISENLKALNINEKFINKIVNKEKIKDVKEILIMTIDNKGEIFFQEKYKPCKTIKVNME